MNAPPVQADLGAWREDLNAELHALADWWLALERPGAPGFLAMVDSDNRPVPDADHHVILATRLLWFFSAFGRASGRSDALAFADHLAGGVREAFVDGEVGGVVWSLGKGGACSDGRKQAYAQAFAIYAFAEHHAARGHAASLDVARALFDVLMDRFRDREHGGYIEALGRGFEVIADVRLSAQAMHAPRTMNTHLHILEALTRLQQVAPSDACGAALVELLGLFERAIFDADSGHLHLFMAADWSPLSTTASFGHDIEASWLLCEAAAAVNETAIAASTRRMAVRLAAAVRERGVSPVGGLYDGVDLSNGAIIPVAEWWAQAEAMVGFLNAFALTGDARFVTAAMRTWRFVKLRHRPNGHGEWTWWPSGWERGGKPVYLAGPWKGPYHNGRALMECVRRLELIARSNSSPRGASA